MHKPVPQLSTPQGAVGKKRRRRKLHCRAAAVVVTMAWESRAAKGHQMLMSSQGFLFLLDLNPD